MERPEIEQAIKELAVRGFKDRFTAYADIKRLMNHISKENSIPFYHVKPYVEASVRFEMEMLKRDAIKEAQGKK